MHFKANGSFVATIGVLLFILAPLINPHSLGAAEKTLTLHGQIDVSGLNLSPDGFTVRAVVPQKRDVELGKTVTDGEGRFQLVVEDDAVGIHGVILEASHSGAPVVLLEAPVLRIVDARAPITISSMTTIRAAILHWKTARHGQDFEFTRPFLLFNWLSPVLQQKAQADLSRAQNALVQWAYGAARAASQSLAAVLKASVGDPRNLRERLTALNVPAAPVKQLEGMVQGDAEVAYLLMMPYLLEL